MNFYKLYRLIESRNNIIIYCDLDGVLVDLERGVREQLGMDKPMSRLQMMRSLAQMRRSGTVDLVAFFGALPWTKDGKDLWNFIEPYNPIILTGGADEANEIGAGKNLWCEKNLGISTNRIIHESQKDKYAGPGKILIDDYDRNSNAFTAAGGIGIIHTDSTNTLNQLKNILLQN